MPKKNVLLIGSSGFVGAQLKKKLKTRYKVFSPSSKLLDLLKIETVQKYLSKKKIDIIINCAWKVNSKKNSMALRRLNKSLNILMARNLVKVAKDNYIKYFLNISSINIYQARSRLLYEKDILNKKNISSDPESLSKMKFIKLLQKVSSDYHYCNLILSNIYGFKKKNNSNLFLDKIFKNIFFKKRHKIYFSENNNSKINFLYIDDIIDAINFFLKKLIQKKLRHTCINICSEKNYYLKSIFKKIEIMTATKIKFNEDNNNTLGITPSNLLAKKYGWRNKTSLKNGLEKTIAEYKKIQQTI